MNTEDELQLVSSAIDNAGKEPWIDPYTWRKQNPSADWEMYFDKYPTPNNQWDGHKKRALEDFKYAFPDANEKDFDTWMDLSEDFNGQNYEGYVKSLPHGHRPKYTPEEYERLRPKMPEEFESEMEQLMSPDELRKFRADKTIPWHNLHPGPLYDYNEFTRNAKREWMKRNPDKVWPKSPDMPKPEEWPPDYQGF